MLRIFSSLPGKYITPITFINGLTNNAIQKYIYTIEQVGYNFQNHGKKVNKKNK